MLLIGMLAHLDLGVPHQRGKKNQSSHHQENAVTRSHIVHTNTHADSHKSLIKDLNAREICSFKLRQSQ